MGKHEAKPEIPSWDAFILHFSILNRNSTYVFNKTLLYQYEITPIISLSFHINACLALNQIKLQKDKPNLPKGSM